jgi:hypothetical protein
MPKLGQILVQRGWASPREVQNALRLQLTAGGRLGTCLLESNSLSEDRLLDALSKQHRLPSADADDLREVPEEAIDILPAKLAIRCYAVPFRVFGTQVHVAMRDPRDLNCHDEIAFALGKKIQAYVATEARIAQALDRYYGEECPSRLATLVERLDRARYLWREQKQPMAVAGGGAEAAPLPPWESLDTALFGDLVPPSPPPGPRRGGSRAQPGPRTETPAKPPAEPPSSISLSQEEEAELKKPPKSEDDDTRPVPPDAPPLPISFGDAETRLERAQDPDEVGRLLIAFLGQMFGRVALFKIVKGRAVGWLGRGQSLDEVCLAGFSVSLDEPSVFLNLREGGGFFLGPLVPMASHKELARCWGGSLPKECIVMPVRIRDRLVTAIYLDRAPEKLGSLDLESMRSLAAAASRAYERCIFRKKKD